MRMEKSPALYWDAILHDSSRESIDSGVNICKNDSSVFDSLLELVREERYPFSVRGSRVVCNSVEEVPEQFSAYLPHILKLLPGIRHESIKFNLLKIFTFCELPTDEEELGLLADLCFQAMEERTVRAAVKIYSIDILFRISKLVPELEKEVLFLIERQMTGATPGFISRAGKIMKSLSAGKL